MTSLLGTHDASRADQCREVALRSILSVSSLILGALSAGCTDSPTSLHQALSSRLVVQPRVDTLAGKGAIIHLTATVGGRDTVASWTSLNDGVATVDSLGTAHSVGAGAAKIVAAVGGLADTATLIVLTGVLVHVDLAPASATLPPAGTIQFAVSGTWTDGSSTAPAVTYFATGGTITPDGLYTAGTAPGTFAVIAIQQGGTTADTSVVTVTAGSAPTLRLLASARHFAMGAAVRDSAFRNDAQYLQTLVTQYNSIVPEDATDFWPIHPGPSEYAFAAADALVSFAQANGMVIHGHSLSWYAWIPTWITGGGYTNDQLRAILKDHITTVVGRYRGRIVSWDVVNEVENVSGTGLRSSFWVDHLGPEYIDSAFVWAHRADPAAKLYLNDYATETINPKSDAVLALAQALKGRGVPIDGVGFQMHILHFWPPPTSAQIQANFARFASAGFDIRITELDVDVADTAGAAALASQGATYRAVLDACLRIPRCIELTTWGFTDRYNWVPQQFPGYGRALPFSSTYQPKPAFDSLVIRLGQP